MPELESLVFTVLRFYGFTVFWVFGFLGLPTEALAKADFGRPPLFYYLAVGRAIRSIPVAPQRGV